MCFVEDCWLANLAFSANYRNWKVQEDSVMVNHDRVQVLIDLRIYW